MILNSNHRRDVFDVIQIALGVSMSVFLVAIYARPIQSLPSIEKVREIRTQQTIYLVEVKYMGVSTKSSL